MATLDKRLTELEGTKVHADLSAMTDEQLSAHLATLEPGSTDWYGVLITSIHRKGSRLPLRNASRLESPNTRLDTGLMAPQSGNSSTQRESTSGNIATHTGSRVIAQMDEMLPISHKKERIS
jgi:hypothetical protein